MKNSANGKKTNVSSKRKTITIDITDFYDNLKRQAEKDVRTVEEEILYFIKRNILPTGIDSITYIDRDYKPYKPYTWDIGSTTGGCITVPCRNSDSNTAKMQVINESYEIGDSAETETN